MGALHQEILTFNIILSPRHPVILGFLWVCEHNPSIDWSSGQVKVVRDGVLIHEGSKEPSLPFPYAKVANVFSEQEAVGLPLHHPCDCAIDLIPVFSLPKERAYPFNFVEKKAMEEYIENSLR